jgi:hypothetical protein
VLVELFGSGWGDHILGCGLVGAVFTLSSNFPMLSITLRNNLDTLFQLLLRKGMLRGGSIESLVISVSFYAAISWLFLVKSLVTFINRGDFFALTLARCDVFIAECDYNMDRRSLDK